MRCYEEIASLLDCPVETVSPRRSRARTKLLFSVLKSNYTRAARTRATP